MDISAALTPEEVAALSDAERSCQETARQLEHAGTIADEGLGTFEESLRLKNTLDSFEEKATSEPSWAALSVLINCEYRLHLLNQNTPLRNNPFLSHWVEAIHRLEKRAAKQAAAAGDGLSTRDVNLVRIEFIKALLQSRSSSDLAHKSPKQLYTNVVIQHQTSSFGIRPYVRMLEEEGIYEQTPEPPEPLESQDAPNNQQDQAGGAAKGKATARSQLSNFQQWKQDILYRLQTEPDTAIPELTHLPVELSYLDFLTTLLQEQTLPSFSIEPAPIISDYIQHALRLTEQIGRPPATSDHLVTNGDADGVVDHGREAQTRTVKLLLLFIKNLIRKALLPPEAIYFEIQEICVRYVWIKEVREFRSFIEEGAGGEQALG